MDRDVIKQWIETHGEEIFSRSSGPGGQHVNKTSTRVQLSIEVAALQGISEDERARLPDRLMVVVQDERSQLTNREIAVARMLERLEKALHRDKPRRKTRPTKASKERRLTAKKVSASHRQNRRIGDE